MAILNFRVKHLTERSDTAARQATQYMRREGEYAPQEVDYVLRTGDTGKHADFVRETHGNLPTWAQDDPVLFFTEAVTCERGGSVRAGRWATSWQMALPKELTREEQWAMGTAFVAVHLQHHAYLIAMHDPIKDGEHQPHLHVLFSEREDHGQTPDAQTYFRRPEVGGCAKDRWFHARGTIDAMREAWADWTNYTLESHGHAERVHPKSLYYRNIDRKPEPKVGYSADPELHARREAIRQQRNVTQEQQQASAGWEARKQRLGITDVAQIHPWVFLIETRERARQHEAGVWSPELAVLKQARYRAAVEREQARLAQERETVTQALRTAEAADRIVTQAQARQPQPTRTRRRSAEERAHGRGYNVKLHEEAYERERDQNQGRGY